jgi:hypothetical protein
VLVASLQEGGRGGYSEPARLEPGLSGLLPISSVSQPTAAEEAEDMAALEGTAWLLALIGSLTFMLLLIASAMFYYRYHYQPCLLKGLSHEMDLAFLDMKRLT